MTSKTETDDETDEEQLAGFTIIEQDPDREVKAQSRRDDEGFAYYVARCPECGTKHEDPISSEAEHAARDCCDSEVEA